MRVRFWHRLSGREAIITILAGLAVGLIFSSVQIGLDLLEEREQIDLTVQQVIQTVQGPAVQAAYDLDESLAFRIVNGLLAYGPIIQARVVDDFGRVLADRRRIESGKERIGWLTKLIFKDDLRYESPLVLRNGGDSLGHILVVVDADRIAANFIRRAQVVLVTEVVRAVVLAGILGLIFYATITRALLRMVRQLSGVNPAQPAEKLLKIPKSHAHDELGLLAHTTNHLLTEFERSLAERRAAAEGQRRQTEYMKALHETAIGLISRLDLNDLFQAMVTRAARLTGATEAFLHIYNPEKDALIIHAGVGIFADQIGFQVEIGDGLAGRVWASGQPRYVEDYNRWPGRMNLSLFDQMRSVMVIPISSGAYMEGGVIGLAHTDPEKRFGENDVEVLQRFSELAAIALDNAQLYTLAQKELAERQRMEKEREKMEAQLRQSQKMEAIGTLAGGIAHDFNNILFPIIGLTDLSLSVLPPDAEVRPNLEKIFTAAIRARDLVGQILTFSRRKEQDKKPVQIQPIVKEAVKLIQATLPSTIEVRYEIDPGARPTCADLTQIHQVVMNLCTNASHAMTEKGGLLEISLRELSAAEETPSSPPGEIRFPCLCLQVRDTGSGIEKSIVEHIFEPYFTTKPSGEGTGMGLAVVYGIVREHGGHITVESQPGRGSCFSVYLPTAGTVDTGSASQPLETFWGKGEHILLVDDEETVLEVMEKMLVRLGYQVTPFADGESALKALQENPDTFSLLMTDMTMPKMTGLDLVKKATSGKTNLPVVLCTGYGNMEHMEKARAAGVREILIKPVVLEDLAPALRRALQSD